MLTDRQVYDILSLMPEPHPQPYSGRSMYGRECIAISGDGSVTEVLADLHSAVHDQPDGLEHPLDPEEFEWLMRHCRWDTMGRGTVVYWPCTRWPADV